VDEKGCPLDSDGDGVKDYLDRCPGTPKGASVDKNGCELDTDGDGVPDWRDECPNSDKKAIGHVDEKGCDLDSDHDGVPDWKDECPMVPGVKENKGCPEVKREIRQLLKKAMTGVEFETSKATIKQSSYALLDEIAQQFIENPSFIIEVQGHTDNTGKADKNLELSQARADAVRDYLISKGVPAERMTAHGYGQERPVADNKTKAGRAKNRRVEFDITFEEVTIETILDHADPEPEPAPEAPAESTTVEQ
jgi:outer membrane protein OmpA-like peptidoglycan-associated protein